MSEAVSDATRGEITFECQLRRIEVHRGGSTAALELNWRVSAIPGRTDPQRGGVRLVGHLVLIQNGNWGQALVVGDVSRATMFTSPEEFADFARRYGAGVIGQMYSVARRSLNANAALMEFAFDIDPVAPAVELEILRAAEVMQPPLV